MAPVKTDEKASMNELAAMTEFRAEETPVSSDTTTNTLRGTRNSEDSWHDMSGVHLCRKMATHRSTMVI